MHTDNIEDEQSPKQRIRYGSRPFSCRSVT